MISLVFETELLGSTGIIFDSGEPKDSVVSPTARKVSLIDLKTTCNKTTNQPRPLATCEGVGCAMGTWVGTPASGPNDRRADLSIRSGDSEHDQQLPT